MGWCAYALIFHDVLYKRERGMNETTFDSEEHQIFRDSFRKFVAREITPHVPEWEKERAVPRSIWLKMGEQGYLCPWLPEEYGGLGLGFDYSVIINEELLRGNAFGVEVPLHSDVATPYIYSFASPEIKKQWLPGCTTGETITAIGLTEPNTGSDLAAIRTRAVKDGDSYVINGQKTFITNGYFADLIVVACKTDPDAGHRGISLILVDKDAPGFQRGRKLEKMGYHMQDTAELFFEDCRVPVGNLLGEEGKGFKYMMAKLQQETVGGLHQMPGLGRRSAQRGAQLCEGTGSVWQADRKLSI